MAIQITFSIPANKVQEFLDGFLEMEPIPTKPDPNNPNTEIPQYPAKDWIKLCGKKYYMRVYRNGKDRLGAKTATKDKNLFA